MLMLAMLLLQLYSYLMLFNFVQQLQTIMHHSLVMRDSFSLHRLFNPCQGCCKGALMQYSRQVSQLSMMHWL